ncbi:MAG: phospho-2-dehydro-3-deoxyheptonate aldolase [Smithella sp. SDB]|nr:MAG: phospho-2-dehydro-3-deoxyheptonate aldolase [Smithella sp. SDB]
MTKKKQDKWTKASWRSFSAKQQPVWPDSNACEETLKKISQLPALVFAGESRSLGQDLAEVLEGRAFVLQAGECSEDYDRCHGPYIHNLLKVILQMSVIITYAGEKKVVKIGRIAGQYAKPRSSDTEKVGKLIIPSYRGDMVNSPDPSPEARVPDPRRMLEGYFRATATLNLVRAFTKGGYAALDQAHAWSEASVKSFPANPKYEELVRGIKKAIAFMDAIGIKNSNPDLNQVSLYTSHEALLLEYEEAMTRIDTTTGDWYDTSANMLWIGDRTRHPEGAHVEFMRGVCNPVGVKIGPSYVMDDIKKIAEKLNPDNIPGRLTMITRLGAEKINFLLPPLLREMKKEGFNIVWICDPMHGNTYINRHSQKTRKYKDILKEIINFWKIHQAEGTIAGGVHLELTGDNVTECTGGSLRVQDKDLRLNYQTNCDPRLNAEQAVELAFKLATIINPYLTRGV